MTEKSRFAAAPAGPVPWHRRYPDRWAHEKAALDAAGWKFTVARPRGRVRLHVAYPLPNVSEPVQPARLTIDFPQTYPHFPPEVADHRGTFVDNRHRNPVTRGLCLLHEEDWSADMTVAQLLAEQMPKLLSAAGQQDVPTGVEAPAPIPVASAVNTTLPALTVPEAPVPTGVDQGALMVRFGTNSAMTRLAAGTVEAILGPGLEIRTELSGDKLRPFFVPVYGRWLRDPDYTPGEAPATVWRRIRGGLATLLHEEQSDQARATDPNEMEVIGLLVPDETGHRQHGESWVFLLRTRTTHRDRHDRSRRRWVTEYLQTQYLSRAAVAARTPIARALADKTVVVVGAGAVGAQIAQDLAQSGLGQLVIIDPDRVDVATGSRQVAAPASAGAPKAFEVAAAIGQMCPFTTAEGYAFSVADAWDPHPSPLARARCGEARRVLIAADLVVDATANPAATRFLAGLRRAHRRAFLHASATAGAWGGVVALLAPDAGCTGCWACVEHARADGLLPVPAADPAGWVNPPRCGEVTFQGARHDLHQLSLMAARVAAHHLAVDPLDGDYFVASLRDRHGRPIPIGWTSAHLVRHPACPLHQVGRAEAVG